MRLYRYREAVRGGLARKAAVSQLMRPLYVSWSHPGGRGARLFYEQDVDAACRTEEAGEANARIDDIRYCPIIRGFFEGTDAHRLAQPEPGMIAT